MSVIKNLGSFGPTDTFDLNEGNVTMETVSGVGGDITKPKYASRLVKGDYVKMSGDMTVTKCSAGDTPIGIITSNPRTVKEPTANASWGSYTPRRASVELFGDKVKTVPLEAANSAVSVGDPIKVGATTYGKFDKGTSSNKTAIALEAATASSGAKIAVLFGYNPI